MSTIAGLLLGVLIAMLVIQLRPRETGLVDLDLIYLEEGPQPGASFVVELETERIGYPVILHLDADGFPSLLFPPGRVARIDPGIRVRLPDPDGSTTWWTEAGIDGGTLLTVLAERPPANFDRLVDLVERAASRADDPHRARDGVIKVLRRRLGEPVETAMGRTPSHDG